MRKLCILGLIALAAVIIGLAWAEQMTFSTYYPAPAGRYREFSTTGRTTLATNEWGTETDEFCRVGIGTTDPEAKLDVASTNSGFLPPRYTDHNAIVAAMPDATTTPGMMAYNLAGNIMEYNNDTEWVPMAGAGGQMYYGEGIGSNANDRAVTLPFEPKFIIAWNNMSSETVTSWIAADPLYVKLFPDGGRYLASNPSYGIEVSGSTITFRHTAMYLNYVSRIFYYVAFSGVQLDPI